MSGEFEKIDLFLQAFRNAGGRTQGDSVELGPGDDAAILSAPWPWVVTTDAIVENVHFRSSWASDEQIGHKALAVNLSDVASMGAHVEAFTCALALPGDFSDERLKAMAHGMGLLAARTGAVLAGGNFTRASELSLTVTAFGTLREKHLRRDRARAGDGVLLVGELGVAAAELQTLLSGGTLPEGKSALHEPEPLVHASEWASRLIDAAIDVSDGLVQDLGHVARASGVRIDVDSSLIPRNERFLQLSAHLDEAERRKLQLAGGEDYALVFFGPQDRLEELQERVGGAFIGHVHAGSGVSVDGRSETPLDGHDHFR